MNDPNPRATLARMLVLLRDKELEELADLYAVDGVHELPFAPPGAPGRIVGREAIRRYFATTLSKVPLHFHQFHEVDVHDTHDPEVIVAEYDASGSVATTGETFQVRYLWVLRIVSSQIALWRDYWNPQEIIALQTPDPARR